MCGIVALWDRSGAPLDPALVGRMSALIRHRGPDDEGYVFIDSASGRWRTYWGPDTPADVIGARTPSAPIAALEIATPDTAAGENTPADLALVSRRLAIIDLTPTGHQPMGTPSGGCWIAYNGELYNYRELRQELTALGHTFRTASDTEVILEAYREWQEDCLSRFNGMWGLALWDGARRRLFLTRDRLGIKPLYTTEVGGLVAASSEISPLLLLRLASALSPAPSLPVVRRFLDVVVIDAGRETFFDGVERLEPAHSALVTAGGTTTRRYWDLPVIEGSERPAGDPDELRRLFDDSVRLRLRSDVPVGTCLSGGIDSSSIVATAAPLLDRSMHTFSVAFDEAGPFDERRFVQLVVERYGTESHLTVPDGGDLFELLPRIVRHQEEPGGGSGLYSQWKVMELAAGHGLKVLLDGQGGDELLAGYVTYQFHRLNDLLASGRLLAWATLLGAVARLHHLGVAHTLGRAMQNIVPAPLFEFASRRLGAGRDLVLGPALRSAEPSSRWLPPRRFPDRLTQQLFHDTFYFLPSLLRYEDRNSMAHSIETRLPFLDYRLVEFLFALPPETKIRDGVTKAIFRDAMRDRVPRPILERRDKVGFDTPTDLWFRDRYRHQLEDILLSERCRSRGLLEPQALKKRLALFFAGRELPNQVWRWFHLELWCRMFMDGEGSPLAS